MALHRTTLDDRAIFRLTGKDARSLLQGLITQDMDKVTPGTAAYGCLLTPQGKFLVDFFLIQIGDALYLDHAATLSEMFFKKLRLYKLRAEVAITNVSADWQVGLVWGDSAEDMEPGPPGQMMGLGSGASEAVAYTDPRLPELGLRLLFSTEDATAALGHFDCGNASPDDFDRHRLKLGVPVVEKDILSEQTFPLDANLDQLNGVDYRKGCFVGQEVASRMKRKGEIRKRLWQGRFDGPQPQAGSAVKAGEQTIGEVASAGDDICLVRLRLDRWEKAGKPDTAETAEGPLALHQPAYL